MGLRNFKDSDGSDWRVWDVVPFSSFAQERRAEDRRGALDSTYGGPERRTGRERRVRTPKLMTPGLEGGWLCFESDQAKRRLTPIPPDWERAERAELERLAHEAAEVRRR